MKNFAILCALILAALALSALGQSASSGTARGRRAMADRGIMAAYVAGSMMRQMAATSDGGVVVLAGSRLTKYDKDLNAVKTVRVKTDLQAMLEETRRNAALFQ